MCYRRDLVRILGALGLSLLALGAVLVFSSPTFLCSMKGKSACTGSCTFSCGETCFCTTRDHRQATIAIVPLLLAPLPLMLACIWWCGDDPLPWFCFCVRENPCEETVDEQAGEGGDEEDGGDDPVHPLRIGFGDHED